LLCASLVQAAPVAATNGETRIERLGTCLAAQDAPTWLHGRQSQSCATFVMCSVQLRTSKMHRRIQKLGALVQKNPQTSTPTAGGRVGWQCLAPMHGPVLAAILTVCCAVPCFVGSDDGGHHYQRPGRGACLASEALTLAYAGSRQFLGSLQGSLPSRWPMPLLCVWLRR
jgi:hypothetical protein